MGRYRLYTADRKCQRCAAPLRAYTTGARCFTCQEVHRVEQRERSALSRGEPLPLPRPKLEPLWREIEPGALLASFNMRPTWLLDDVKEAA